MRCAHTGQRAHRLKNEGAVLGVQDRGPSVAKHSSNIRWPIYEILFHGRGSPTTSKQHVHSAHAAFCCWRAPSSFQPTPSPLCGLALWPLLSACSMHPVLLDLTRPSSIRAGQGLQKIPAAFAFLARIAKAISLEPGSGVWDRPGGSVAAMGMFPVTVLNQMGVFRLGFDRKQKVKGRSGAKRPNRLHLWRAALSQRRWPFS